MTHCSKYEHPEQRPFILFWSLFFIILFGSACGQTVKKEDSVKAKITSGDLFTLNVPDSLRYLLPILDSIYGVDQKYRSGVKAGLSFLNSQQTVSGRLSPEAEEMRRSDSTNARIICSILDRYGWLGASEIGPFGNLTFFMVIQHADSAIQEMYLPLLRIAVASKKNNSFNLAQLEDRLSYKKVRKQIYGTQTFYSERMKRYYLLPINHPENAENKRREIGIDSASYAGYLNKFKLKWDLNLYNNDTLFVSKYLSSKRR